jgi:hypothetical protein
MYHKFDTQYFRTSFHPLPGSAERPLSISCDHTLIVKLRAKSGSGEARRIPFPPAQNPIFITFAASSLSPVFRHSRPRN